MINPQLVICTFYGSTTTCTFQTQESGGNKLTSTERGYSWSRDGSMVKSPGDCCCALLLRLRLQRSPPAGFPRSRKTSTLSTHDIYRAASEKIFSLTGDEFSVDVKDMYISVGAFQCEWQFVCFFCLQWAQKERQIKAMLCRLRLLPKHLVTPPLRLVRLSNTCSIIIILGEWDICSICFDIDAIRSD